MKRILLALCISASACSPGLAQTSHAGKLKALQSAVCNLPYGETIDVSELPRRSLASEWESRLNDELPLSLVSIPATHDAGTALARTGLTRCQVLTLPAQLAVGVRGYDIRLRLVHNELGVYHNEENEQLSFVTILKTFKDFLTAHPREFLVMRVREESQAIDSDQKFEDAFERLVQSDEYASLFYKATSRTEIPAVGGMRGKILILDNYGKLVNTVDYPNASMNVQDDYDLSDMAKKYSEIVDNFQSALAQTSGSIWNLNYTSSCDAQVDQLGNAKAVNPRVCQFLSHRKGHLGMVLMNFPGIQEIRDIYESNFKK